MEDTLKINNRLFLFIPLNKWQIIFLLNFFFLSIKGLKHCRTFKERKSFSMRFRASLLSHWYLFNFFSIRNQIAKELQRHHFVRRGRRNLPSPFTCPGNWSVGWERLHVALLPAGQKKRACCDMQPLFPAPASTYQLLEEKQNILQSLFSCSKLLPSSATVMERILYLNRSSFLGLILDWCYGLLIVCLE